MIHLILNLSLCYTLLIYLKILKTIKLFLCNPLSWDPHISKKGKLKACNMF